MAKQSRFDTGQEYFFQVLGPTQPPMQWIPGTFPWGVKRPGREADHLHPSSVEVSLPYACMARCLISHAREHLYLYSNNQVTFI
jgi:hypothetical protein